MKQVLKEVLAVVLLGGFGGFIRTLAGKRREDPYCWRIGVSEVMIAIFAGLLVHWFASEYLQSDNMRTAAVALAGYSARGIMALLDAAFLARCKALAKFFSRLGM